MKYSIIRLYIRYIMSGLEGAYNGLVPFTYEAYPGHFWTRLNLEDGGILTLTDESEQLPPDERAYILDQLFTFREFRAQTNRKQHLGEIINSGKEGTVFTLGDDFVIKVIEPYGYTPDTDYPTRMLRMAFLREIVSQSQEFPDWVEVVENYLFIVDSDDTTYTVMPKIGNGVTMDDLLAHVLGLGQKSNRIAESIRRDFPGFSMEEWEILRDQLSHIIDVFDSTLNKSFPTAPPYPYLDDLGISNVIVTRVDERYFGYPYKLWVIDQ